MPELIMAGIPTAMIQNIVYALPGKACLVSSQAPLEYADDIAGPWFPDSLVAFLEAPSQQALTARVQSATNNTINQGSVPVTFASPPTVGNGIVMAVVSGDVTGVTDNRGNSYQLALQQLGGSGNVNIWFCPSITSTGNPFIVTAAGGTFQHRLGAAIEANSGLAVDKSFAKNAGSAPSLNPTTGSTPALTVNEALVVAAIVEGNNQTTITVESVSPTWNQDGEILGVVYGEIDSRILTSGNGVAQSCSWVVAPNSAGYWTCIVAFKGAAATKKKNSKGGNPKKFVRSPTSGNMIICGTKKFYE